MPEKKVGKDTGQQEGKRDQDEALEGVLEGDEGLGLAAEVQNCEWYN